MRKESDWDSSTLFSSLSDTIFCIEYISKFPFLPMLSILSRRAGLLECLKLANFPFGETKAMLGGGRLLPWRVAGWEAGRGVWLW